MYDADALLAAAVVRSTSSLSRFGGTRLTSPIADPNLLDVTGVRKGGGIDLGISAAGPIDDSPDTLARLRKKLTGYLIAAQSPRLWSTFPDVTPGPIRILVFYSDAISPAARTIMEKFGSDARKRGVEFCVEQRPA